MATHPVYNAKEEAGAADPPGPGYAHRPSTFLNLYNPKRGEVPALQYLQALAAGTCPADSPAAVLRMPEQRYLRAFSCRNVSCRLSCSCPAHACAPLQAFPYRTVSCRLSCSCPAHAVPFPRSRIYKHFAAGKCPAACPAAVLPVKTDRV